MLNPQLIANYLQEQLNNYGQESKYTFVIYAEVGKPQNSSAISGIVKSADTPSLSPIQNYTEVKYSFRVELIVPAAGANAHYIAINNIVGQMIEAQNGTSALFGDGTGIVTFSATKPEKYDIAYGAGSVAPIEFMVYVLYTGQLSTVTSGDKVWKFDNIVIPYLSESVTVETEGVTRKIFSEQYSKTLKTGQTRYYNFEVPQTSQIGAIFQALILNNNVTVDPVHTLTYTDNITYTSENPFVTKVVLYRSGNVKTVKPSVSTLTITFTDADDPQNAVYPMYYIGLIDFPYDMNGEDTMYFTSQTAQQSYFADALSNGAEYDRIAAPNLNSIDITRQIYPNTRNYSMLELAKKNYAVIQYAESGEAIPQYLYYFITDCQIGAGGQIMFDLHLDTVQTYFFDPTVSFADCLIERAHLNRFQTVEGQPDYVQFVTDPATKIYNAEDALNYPKRLTKRTKIGLAPTGNQAADEWLAENVLYWVYLYIDPTQKYNIISISDLTATSYSIAAPVSYDTMNIYGAAGCICYPVYSNTENTNVINCVFETYNSITIGGYSGLISNEGASWAEIEFKEKNNDAAYYYNKKISIISPFNSSWADSMHVVDGNLIITMKNSNSAVTFYYAEDTTVAFAVSTSNVSSEINGKLGVFTKLHQTEPNIPTLTYSLPYNDNILISDIKTATGTDRLALNPKLNSENFRELIITASSGDTFTYDIQKLQQNQISFLYTEPLQPEITKYYMRVNPCGLYEQGTQSNYTGLVGSTDTSIAYTIDNYAQFLANNKNFWMQSNMKIVAGVTKSVYNAFSGIGTSAASGAKTGGASGAIVGAATGAISAQNTLVNTAIDTTVSLLDRNMTIDNLRSAPEQMKNANGNVIFNAVVTNLGLYVEEFTALDGDLQSAFDFMNLFGFAVNSIGDIKDYVNIRKYHNYIKAQLQAITGAMSNTARNDLRQRFANGIRFWNIETPDYTQENYENWLDE